MLLSAISNVVYKSRRLIGTVKFDIITDHPSLNNTWSPLRAKER
jgi:hypothetical protein